MTSPNDPLVTVLLATRNGAEFLGEQLASLAKQNHLNWRLQISDDGSTDGTLAMLETFRDQFDAGRVTITQGPSRGATANFLSLIAATGPQDGFLAFCDQDDVWMPEKLTRAIDQTTDIAGPVIWCCRVIIAGKQANGGAPSKLPVLPLGFAHALAENTLIGCAMVLNPAAAAILRSAVTGSQDADLLEAGYHDWLAYQVVTAAGGRVVIDEVPGVLYRQHGGNLVGSGQAPGRLLHRIRRALGGAYGLALRRQARALLATPGLAPQQRAQAMDLLSLRSLPFWHRPRAILRLGIYRQSWREDLVLKLLLLFGRV